ncbi:RidA family protein [Flexilinea flocculi]|jgi:2-iminobutanoate/2-iminopropanoate deaminase|uniref:Enamine deaminase RidA, house cleaning of reactive enamine intermediates, YjgF/YER057c/UK114 family n=1 Tax=Flexilinea flocculi TaxID=1678840 RepID=A0A0K8PB32_9CHLR|nr:RidA family protein [Flexilinea flocculi]GAP39872.1 enamine deaminase RidA, house cleaning of reactive enamine intermediates, YjgF/YER057c/UK114 family [Flexilinea flocculi]
MSNGISNLPFSKYTIKDSSIYISGAVGRDENTGIMSSDIAEQTETLLKNLKRLLETAGSSLNHCLKINIYLTDMRYFSDMNQAYRKYFDSEHFPARTCIAVIGLPDPEAKVEMDVIAEVCQ